MSVRKFRLFLRSLKHFWQRIWRGFSDDETWSLDFSLSKLILPRLKRFKEITRAYPSNMTYEEWSAILDKMIFSFEEIAKGEMCSLEIGNDPRIQEGLDLFAEYFQALWW